MTIEPSVGSDAQTVITSSSSPQPTAPETGQIARTASIISLGNVASRVLGLARESVKSHFFGAGATVDAYNIAALVPVMLYDLLVGGMVNSSLVPVFSEYVQQRREELWGLVSILLSLMLVVLIAFILIIEVFPLQVVFLLSSGKPPDDLELAARLLRITVPAVIFLGLSGLLTGVLYALKRFTLPAFTATVFNASIVTTVLLFGNRLNITSMALGLLTGAMLQVALQLPGLKDARLRFRLTFAHPGLRRVTILYMPILLGLVVDVLALRVISYNLASMTGEGGISWMSYATTLVQLPQGLVATAVSFAILPTLSVQAAHERTTGHQEAFQATLARGLRLVIVLIIPATVGLFILAHPTVALVLGHGDFLARDTAITSQALQLYLLGLPFAAVDLLLVFSFYARQDTLTPSLIGIGTIVLNLATALLLMPTIGLFSLMIADSVKQLAHALVSWVILRRRLGNLAEHGVFGTLGKTLLASAVMGVVTYGMLRGIQTVLPGDSLIAEGLVVGIPALLGAVVYLGLVTHLRVEEINLLWLTLRRLVGRYEA
ncbi:MAG: murein biosynthesis integral membrane protein MurJ [Anaerolineae bacterium]|nr:murein biosynthesis integral membrane protein MurJ [Anaerolineae bacterium]